MRLLFWNEDKKRPAFSGKKFTLFKVTWNVRTRLWEEKENGHKWGLFHPIHGRLVALGKAPERYGRVIETPDISVSATLGTPTVGVVENDTEADEEE